MQWSPEGEAHAMATIFMSHMECCKIGDTHLLAGVHTAKAEGCTTPAHVPDYQNKFLVVGGLVTRQAVC